MRGFQERFGHMVRVEFDSEQKRFVERLVGDVCPTDYSVEQVQEVTATLAMFTMKQATAPAVRRNSRTARAVAG